VLQVRKQNRNEVGKGRGRVMKQKNLISGDAVNRQIWRKANENR
jgi:hypothetical protein